MVEHLMLIRKSMEIPHHLGIRLGQDFFKVPLNTKANAHYIMKRMST